MYEHERHHEHSLRLQDEAVAQAPGVVDLATLCASADEARAAGAVMSLLCEHEALQSLLQYAATSADRRQAGEALLAYYSELLTRMPDHHSLWEAACTEAAGFSLEVFIFFYTHPAYRASTSARFRGGGESSGERERDKHSVSEAVFTRITRSLSDTDRNAVRSLRVLRR